MWIRDALPQRISGIRFILYGYDSRLVGSNSFQKVEDLAVNLVNALKAGGWTLGTARALAFMAHSLGGILLKQTFVMLAGSGESEDKILAKTTGALFFGVPSQGMETSDISALLGHQPNIHALVSELSVDSQFLLQLERQVSGLSHVRRMKLFWAYET